MTDNDMHSWSRTFALRVEKRKLNSKRNKLVRDALNAGISPTTAVFSIINAEVTGSLVL